MPQTGSGTFSFSVGRLHTTPNKSVYGKKISLQWLLGTSLVQAAS